MLRNFTVALLLAVLLSAAPLAEAAAPAIPVNVSNAAGQFAGSLTITKFAMQQNQLVAIGTLTGTVTARTGQAVGSVVQTVTLPVLRSSSRASCPILHLELGPLDLNLLGLRIQLNKVVLDITAEPGSLLGDLLCALANLFDGIDLGAIANLLNQILAAL
jgi:hypothetical protein